MRLFQEQKSNNFNHFIIVGLLIIAGIIFFHPIIFLDYIIPWDISQSYYPITFYTFNSIQNGELPLWITNYFGGKPLFADAILGQFYPLNFIVIGIGLILKTFPYRLFEIYYISHFILAGIFTYFFCYDSGKISRTGSFAAGIIFMSGAFFVAHLEAYSPLTTLIWLPLLLYLSRRTINGKTSPIWPAIILTVAFLAGYFPAFLVVCFVIISYVIGMTIFKRKDYFVIFKKFAFVFIIPFFLSAVYLLPAIETEFLETPSHVKPNPALSAIGSGHDPLTLSTFILPKFFGSSNQLPFASELNYWPNIDITLSVLYLGIFPLILFFVGIRYKFSRESLALIIIGGIGFFEAFSNLTPFPYLLFYTPIAFLIRQWDFFVVFLMSFSFIAALGLDRLLSTDKNDLNRILKKLLIVPLVAIIVYFFIIQGYMPLNDALDNHPLRQNYIQGGIQTQYTSQEIINNITFYILIFILMILISIFLIFLLKQSKKQKQIVSLILIFIFADLLIFNSGQQFSMKPYDATWATPEKAYTQRDTNALDFFRTDSTLYRIEVNANTLWGNGAGNHQLIHDINTVGGYNNKPLKNYVELLSTFEVLHLERWIDDNVDINSKFFDLFNVKYLLTNGSLLDRWPDADTRKWSLVYDDNSYYQIYKNNDVLERTFVVPYILMTDDNEETAKMLKNPDINLKNFVLVAQSKLNQETIDTLKTKNLLFTENQPQISSENLVASTKIVHYSSNSVIIETNTNQDGFLLLSDIYFPGWVATIDGNPTEIFEADLALRAIFLPEGSHQVKFSFEPLIFKIGAIISGVTLASLIFLIIRNHKLKQNQQSESKSPKEAG